VYILEKSYVNGIYGQYPAPYMGRGRILVKKRKERRKKRRAGQKKGK